MVENIVAENVLLFRRKFWLPAFSPFPTMFTYGHFFKILKSRDCMEKGKCEQIYNFVIWQRVSLFAQQLLGTT